MWALKVTRSTMAATRRGSVMTWPHSLKGSVAELVQAEEVQASVAGHDPRQAAFVGGLGELVDQLGGGGVADPPSHDLRLAPPRSFTVSGTSAYILLHRHGRGEVIGRHARLRKGFD
jgi:hypothetical protein